MRDTKQNLLLVFVVFCLFSLTICQGGGGGGGGGGGDSSDGDYSYIPSCQERCQNLQPCVSDCFEQLRLSKARSDLQTAIILGTLGGSSCILITVCCIFCPGNKCKCCYFHKYQKLKRNYLKNVCLTKMSVQEFDSKCQYFLQVIKHNSIVFLQNQTQYVSTITEVQSKKESDFIVEVTLKGSDHFGTWSSQGLLISLDSGLLFWMYKQYDNKSQGNIHLYQHQQSSNTYLTNRTNSSQYYLDQLPKCYQKQIVSIRTSTSICITIIRSQYFGFRSKILTIANNIKQPKIE